MRELQYVEKWVKYEANIRGSKGEIGWNYRSELWEKYRGL
jgi:hypothetical protein